MGGLKFNVGDRVVRTRLDNFWVSRCKMRGLGVSASYVISHISPTGTALQLHGFDKVGFDAYAFKLEDDGRTLQDLL